MQLQSGSLEVCFTTVLLYYITDRSQFPGSESDRRQLLLEKIAECARAGVHYIQLREKDLSSRELTTLARAAIQAVRENSPSGTRLLINSRTDVAYAVGAGGVHLPTGDLEPAQVRDIWERAGGKTQPIITAACHSPSEVAQAAANSASMAIFAPVFEKPGVTPPAPTGLAALRAACAHPIPVLALGGVTLQNAASCLEAGAAGVAAIRLFQENDANLVVEAISRLTALS